MRYYAFTDDINIVCIGEYETITDAMDNEPQGTVWTVNESALLALASKIAIEVAGAHTVPK